MNFQKFFHTLQDWKKLPAYKLEPRIDSFIGFFLPDILKRHLDVEVIDAIPELPIRLGTVNPDLEDQNQAERSYKVDFYILGADGIHYFIEVKSDMSSRRGEQDDYLQKSVECGMQSIIEGIISISKATSYKYRDKYEHLLGKLRNLGIIDDEKNFTSSKDEIKVIYIQPREPEKEKGERVIDFKSIAEILRKKYPEDDFIKEFAEALEVWAED